MLTKKNLVNKGQGRGFAPDACALCHKKAIGIPFKDLCWHHPVFENKRVLICSECEFAFCEPLDSNLYDDYYENHYKNLLGIHPWINKYLQASKFDSKFLYNFFSASRYLNTFKRFLEIGSGDGQAIKTLRRISNVDIYATDYNLSKRFLQKYKVRNFDLASNEQIKFFDCVYSNHTFEHISIDNLKDLLIKLGSLLSDNGILIIGLPNEYHAVLKMNSHSPHANFFSPKSAVKLLELAGYTILECLMYGDEEDITNKYCPPNSIFSCIPSPFIRQSIVLVTFPIKKLRNIIKNIIFPSAEDRFNFLSKKDSANILIIAKSNIAVNCKN